MIVVVEPPTQLTRIPKWAGRSTLPRVWDDSCLERDCPAEDWPKCWLTPINIGPGRWKVPQTIIPDIRLKFDLWDPAGLAGLVLALIDGQHFIVSISGWKSIWNACMMKPGRRIKSRDVRQEARKLNIKIVIVITISMRATINQQRQECGDGFVLSFNFASQWGQYNGAT